MRAWASIAILPLLLGAAACSQAAGPADAGRVAVVGTPVSLVKPQGFTEGAAAGIANADGSEVIRAFPMPDSFLFEDGIDSNPTLPGFLDVDGFVSTGPAEKVTAGGKLAFVQGGTVRATQTWIAVFNTTPSAAITFSGFDREEMTKVLDTVQLTASEARGDGAIIRGLFLPLKGPFKDADVGGVVESATLSLAEEKGRDRNKPHIDLFFPDMKKYGGQGLESIAAQLLEIDFVRGGTSKEATLLGLPALRQQGEYRDGSAYKTAAGYVALIGGQAVVLVARGPTDTMTDDVIAAVDQAAAELKQYIPR